MNWRVMVGYTSWTMVDVTAWYNAEASTLNVTAHDAAAVSAVFFRFPFPEPNVGPIRELMQVWAGWQQGGVWLDDPPPFIGYLQLTEGGQSGDQHTIHGEVSGLHILNTRATVVGWPTGEVTGIPDLDANGDPVGYPMGYSVTNWLIGTAPYLGVLRSYTANVLYDGIDPVFDTIILDADAMPGGSLATSGYARGQWGTTDLDTVLQDLVGVARYKAAQMGLYIEPVYWWETAAQGSLLRPRFRFADNTDVSGPIRAVFSTTPAAGEYPIE